MNAYDCHYYDHRQPPHLLPYARDILHARQQTEELVGKNLSRITGMVKVDNF